MPALSRTTMDAWLPTLLRYVGLLMFIVLFLEAVFAHVEYPSMIVVATALVAYKTVIGNGTGKGEGTG